MGVVYKVKDTKLGGRITTLKVIHPHLLNSQDILNMFRQEVMISRDLRHFNIVRVYDINDYNGLEFFTMEWIEGKALREIIEERKKTGEPFTLDEAYPIISQLCDALTEAHKLTVHRDIKPENILIAADNALKLTDFGLAMVLDVHKDARKGIGTAYYMSPEQKNKPDLVDQRSDIYSVGVVLFELLTLENTIGPEPPTEFNPSLPPEINDIYRKCVAIRKENRYGNARELSDAFLNIVEKTKDEKRRHEEEIRQKEVEEGERKRQEEKRLKNEAEEAERRQKEEEEKERQETLIKQQQEKDERVRCEREQFLERKKIEEEERKEQEQKKQHREQELKRVKEEKKQKEEEKKQEEEDKRRHEAEDAQRKQEERKAQTWRKADTEVIVFLFVTTFIIFAGVIGLYYYRNYKENVTPAETIQYLYEFLKPAKKTAATTVPVPAKPTLVSAYTDPVTGMEFVFVKGGCFDMGDTFGGGSSDEKPVHNVCVSDFSIGKYEVTQGQWKTIMGSNPSHLSSCGDTCPVEEVSWDDAQGFIQKLNSRTGKSYRLPTEAEWEYAARSGGKKEKYAGTSSDSELGNYAWYYLNSGSKTHPVGQKQPNSLGLYDMTGNVWEWVSDLYDENYYKRSPRDNPQGPSSGRDRVLRGGSWDGIPGSIRASVRGSDDPSDRDFYSGFRIASSPR